MKVDGELANPGKKAYPLLVSKPYQKLLLERAQGHILAGHFGAEKILERLGATEAV